MTKRLESVPGTGVEHSSLPILSENVEHAPAFSGSDLSTIRRLTLKSTNPAADGVANHHLSRRALTALVHVAMHARPNGLVSVPIKKTSTAILLGIDELIADQLLSTPTGVIGDEDALVLDLGPAIRGGR